jgi:hypothetical protein
LCRTQEDDQVIRKVGIVAVVVAALTLSATVVLAQSGHFLTGGRNAPTCTDIGTQVECSGAVAGLGGTTFEIRIEAQGTASVVCINPAGNHAPGQDTSVTVGGTTGPLATPKNGRYNFTITTDAPTVPNTPTCPNPQWTAVVTDVAFTTATLSLYEDNVLVDQVTVPVN